MSTVVAVDTITFTPVPAALATEPALREQLLHAWVRVTDNGGAVGFVAPADRALIGETLDAALERVAAGRDELGVLRREAVPAAAHGAGQTLPAENDSVCATSCGELHRATPCGRSSSKRPFHGRQSSSWCRDPGRTSSPSMAAFKASHGTRCLAQIIRAGR